MENPTLTSEADAIKSFPYLAYSFHSLLTLLILFLRPHAHAQHKVTPDSLYIQPLKDLINIKFGVSNHAESFAVITPDTKFDIWPNTPLITRFQFNYRLVSFGFALAPKFLPGNDDIASKGKTHNLDFRTTIITRHLIQSLAMTRTRGYYLNNTADFVKNWTTHMPYIQFPDLRSVTFSGATGYSFSSRFSIKSLTTQTERQLKSAGSFIPYVRYRLYFVNDRSSPVNTQRSRNLELLAGPGYYYNFVIKDFYLGLGLTASGGYVFSKVFTRFPGSTEKTNGSNFVGRYDALAGVGYNGKKVFFGAVTDVGQVFFKQRGTTVINTNSQVSGQVFIGFHVVAPPKLRTLMDRMEAKTNEGLEKLRSKKKPEGKSE